MTLIKYKPGKLVKFRGREWITLPSDDPDLLLLKPMGGAEEEIAGVYLPIQSPHDQIEEARFPLPTIQDLNDFPSAKLLFDATRLSFRNASGPFRCMGKLSFRPRSYQIVPLVMALRQEKVRLLIADDVGIGKTIEALVILKELMERGEIKRFAVICLPHLCDQWYQELKDKLDIEAEVIRSSTAASLDRKLPDDRSVFYHLPYQVISVDYIKSDKRRDIFLADCPELVIVDEVHSCARPAGATSSSQQQRFHLLSEIVKKRDPHLIFLTATPHSGKDEEFQSILGLLNPELETFELQKTDQSKRRKIAKHFIQRKRGSIKRWVKEDTPFPARDSKEKSYSLSEKYNAFYQEVLKFARVITHKKGQEHQKRMRYWAALALLRGVMSSPATGYQMFKNRQFKGLDDEQALSYQRLINPLIESTSSEAENDNAPTEYIDNAQLKDNEWQELEALSTKIIELGGPDNDIKLKQAIEIIKEWIKDGFHPIVFCKYIPTANYVGRYLKEELPHRVQIEVITSELADEQRREKIALFDEAKPRVLVATDCLSEGINLQEWFTAVLHYDLPWNPNRIEQRDGRVDRFGQLAKTVKSVLLYGEDNLIDRKVLEILIRKVREIQRSTGVSITLGEESANIMDSLIKDVLLESRNMIDGKQVDMFADEFYKRELNDAREKAESLKSIFTHESIPEHEIEVNLKEVDEAIGDVESVEQLVKASIIHMGGDIIHDGVGYQLNLLNLPEHLKIFFPLNKPIRISFESPTPAGYKYVGRNHRFVEQLCQFLLLLAFESHPQYQTVTRAAVIQTDKVQVKTTLIQFRVRNVIKEVKGPREVISEEMYLWGYAGSEDDAKILDYVEAKKLLKEASSIRGLPIEVQETAFTEEMRIFQEKERQFDSLAEERALHLVEAHGRFKDLAGGKKYEAVYPVLPPDIMGVYILNPVPKELF